MSVMSKKDSERNALHLLETPTAAFPIGSLGLDSEAEPKDPSKRKTTTLRNLVRDLDLEETGPIQRSPSSPSWDDLTTDVAVSRHAIDQAIHETDRPGRVATPILIALALLSGGLLALGAVALIGIWLLRS